MAPERASSPERPARTVIGFMPHPHRPRAVALAEATATWLEKLGHQARVFAASSGDAVGAPDGAVEELNLAVSLGGDGTMLRTVDLVSRHGIPVLGVNVGHLGYLSGVEPDELEQALTRFLAGDYRLEERMTLDVDIHTAAGASPSGPVMALNDVVLQRTVPGHTVRIAVSVQGMPFLSYSADSLIVATPTGSTAYNLSARGPIVSPAMRSLVLTPVAPHMLFDRSLVLAAEETVDLEVVEDRSAELVIDGHSAGLLCDGDRVQCRAGRHDARLVSFGERDFYRILKQKFGLPDR